MRPYAPPKCPRTQSRQERDYPCVYEAGHVNPCAFSATPLVHKAAKGAVLPAAYVEHGRLVEKFFRDDKCPTCSTFEVDEAGIRVCPSPHGHAGPHLFVSPDVVLPQVCPRWLAGQHATCSCKDCQEAVDSFVKCRSAAEKPMPAAKLGWAFPAAFFDVAMLRGQEREGH